jgi:hypothetical protein
MILMNSRDLGRWNSLPKAKYLKSEAESQPQVCL